MKIKNLLVTTLAVAAGLTLTACQSDKSEGASTSQEGEAVTLNFGAMGSIDTIPFVIAQENGYFEEEGIKVNLELFNAAKDRDAALQAGQLDGVLADETAIAIYQNSDMDMQITGATNGYWTLVATEQSNIHSLEDLKGKTLIVCKGTTAETFFTENYPEVNLLKFDQYTEAYNALLDGRGDALSTDNTEVLAWAIENEGFSVGIESLGNIDTIAAAVQKGNQDLLDWLNNEIVELGKENFFHADYEETLAPVYGEAADADNIVVESGVVQ